jgi:hypothetical protein
MTENTYSEDEVWELCLKALNMGMSIRQNQLQGYAGNKSGKEHLETWFTVIKERKSVGLDIKN